MGYYDEEGQYHSFRHGLHRAAERVGERIAHPLHPHHHHHGDRDEVRRVEVDTEINTPAGPRYREDRDYRGEYRDYGGFSGATTGVAYDTRVVARGGGPNTITIPCHHIRIGDLVYLQGRVCQVIRISTSSQTGQHRYLGVDLYTKQLYEESSFSSNPSDSVYVQSMLGPVFKQYRVLDIRGDGRVVAMTENGDIRQGLPILDQGQLWSRLQEVWANGRGSVRVLVINDGGREIAVDYKVIHGSRL